MDSAYTRLIERIKQYNPGCDFAMIEKAYLFSKSAHEGQLRVSGEPFILHPLEVAFILADLELDCTSVTAAILHDTIEDTDYTIAQLKEKFGRLSPVSKPPVKHENAPEVFICHSSIDKEFAASLYQEFNAAGLKPWLDKENLRGGDDWNLKIKETLGNVDYFVVLQSQALAKQHRGYVIKEINWALEKKTEFRRGVRFIIPVKIDDSPLLEELKDIQTIDLTDRKNVSQVIDTITRDFKKRGRL